MRRSTTLLGLSVLGLTLALPLGVLVASTGAAAAGDAVARGSAAASATAGPVAVRAVDSYRLATGDTVRVLTRADGSRVPRVMGRTPFVWSGGPEHLYVVPRTPEARSHALDLSLFDTTALARVTRHGRTPVVVRFAPGAGPASVGGLRLAPGTAARAVGRSTVVHATYGRHFPGFSAHDLTAISSVRLDAPQASTPRASAADVPTHTVKVHVARRNGSAADFAIVTVQSTVDGESYLEQSDLDPTGVATFSDVPEGEYSVVAFSFEKVLLDRQFEVAADRTVELNLGDATVKPHVTLPDHRLLSASLNVERDPERGFGIPFGFSGSRFDVRVQPTRGNVHHGSLHTGVTATLVRGRAAEGYDDVALTADVARGVPDDLTFVHHRREFARVTDRIYGNGPAHERLLMLIPGDTHMILFGGETELMVPVPGRFHLWVLAGRAAYAQQTVFPLDDGSFDENTQIIDVRDYRTPGRLDPISFLHGPVGPGLELPPQSRFSSAVRRGDHLQLFMPLMSGAGRSMFDFVDPRDASWALHLGKHTLARGRQEIVRDVLLPHGPRTYRLVARTHPGKAWDLSTHVSDVWTFHSRAGRRAVGLVTPRYVPPTDLAGNLGPGLTGFPLSFHSTPHSPAITRVRVELSTNDGHTWHHAKVTRTSRLTFHVGYHNPAAHGLARAMSLRVTAYDAHGNWVKETAIRAYRLR